MHRNITGVYYVYMDTKINQQQALQILINAIQVATKRGAFELMETKTILEAVETFTKAPTEEKENTDDSKEN